MAFISVQGFPSSATTVKYRIVQSDGTELLALTATGVTERTLGFGSKSTYYVLASDTFINDYFEGWVMWECVAGGITTTAVEEFRPKYPVGTVSTDAGNASSSFKVNRTEADSYWLGTYLKFTSGALAGQVKKVASFTNSTQIMTFTSSFTATPADGSKFILING